jgi:cytoskeletal protein CcmA (bactofilin family)
MKLSFSRNGTTPEAPSPAGYSVLDAQMYVRGDLATDGTIRIDGRLEGNITKSDIVVVGSKASVVGNVVAREVVIGGSVEGNITAESRVELDSGAVVIGDIIAGSILTHEGAQIRGKVIVRTGDAAAAEQAAPADVVTLEGTSDAAVDAVEEAVEEAASLLSERGAKRSDADENWVFPPDAAAAGRPVRITPASEEEA